jgi:hypothetical protein
MLSMQTWVKLTTSKQCIRRSAFGVLQNTPATRIPLFLSSLVSGSVKTLRADTCKYRLQLCKIEKSKIPKLCHNKGFRYLITEIQVSVHSRNYFSFAATFPSRTLQGQVNRLKIPLLSAHSLEIIKYWHKNQSYFKLKEPFLCNLPLSNFDLTKTRFFGRFLKFTTSLGICSSENMSNFTSKNPHLVHVLATQDYIHWNKQCFFCDSVK